MIKVQDSSKVIDPYIDESTGVLRNKLGITDKVRLKQAEADICLPKIITAGKNFSNQFDVKFIKDLHKHIFEDIYDWAGEFRTVNLYKTETVIPGLSLDYAPPKKIEEQLEKYLGIMNRIDWENLSFDDKAEKFTRQLALLWRVHPFRDGNTRTMMTFAYLFARSHDFPLDLLCIIPNLTRVYGENGRIKKFSIRDKLVLASLDENDNPEPEYLCRVIKDAMRNGIAKRKIDRDDFDER